MVFKQMLKRLGSCPARRRINRKSCRPRSFKQYHCGDKSRNIGDWSDEHRPWPKRPTYLHCQQCRKTPACSLKMACNFPTTSLGLIDWPLPLHQVSSHCPSKAGVSGASADAFYEQNCRGKLRKTTISRPASNLPKSTVLGHQKRG